MPRKTQHLIRHINCAITDNERILEVEEGSHIIREVLDFISGIPHARMHAHMHPCMGTQEEGFIKDIFKRTKIVICNNCTILGSFDILCFSP